MDAIKRNFKDGTCGRLWRVFGGCGVEYYANGQLRRFGGMNVEYKQNGQINRIGSHVVTYNKQGLIENIADYPRVEYTKDKIPRLTYLMGSSVIYYYYPEHEYNPRNIEPDPEPEQQNSTPSYR